MATDETDWAVAASNGDVGNLSEFTFPTAGGADSGAIDQVALRDASTGGNLLLHADVQETLTVGNGETARFPALGSIIWDWNAD